MRTQPVLYLPPQLEVEPVKLFGRERYLHDIDDILLARSRPTTADPFSPPGRDRPDGARSLVLAGMGGMGKTTLVARWAATRSDKFDAIFWVDSSDKNALSASFAAIDQHIRTPADTKHDYVDYATSQAQVHRWLTNPTRVNRDGSIGYASWLIVFDGADDISLLEPYWPLAANCGTIIVTTRETTIDRINKATFGLFAQELARSRFLALEKYAVSDSIDMLLHLAHGTASDHIPAEEYRFAFKLCGRLGGLPLAIEHLAGILRNENMSYQDCLTLIDPDYGLDNHVVPERPAVSEPAIAFLLSCRHLSTSREQRSMTDKKNVILCLLAYLSPAGVHFDLLLRLATQGDVMDGDMSEADFRDTLQQLVRHLLVQHRISDGMVIAHGLVRDLIRQEVSQDDSTRMLLRVASSLAKVSDVKDDLHERFHASRLAIYSRIAKHVAALKALWDVNPNPSLDWPRTMALVQLMSCIEVFFYHDWQISESRALCHAIRIILEQRKDIDTNPDIQFALRKIFSDLLAVAVYETDADSAIHYYQTWEKLCLRHKVDTAGDLILDYELGMGYNEGGTAYALKGDLNAAEQLFRKSVQVYRSRPNSDPKDLGWPLPNLGFILWLQGRLEDARSVLLEIKDIFESAYGPDDTRSFHTGKILHALGNVYFDLDDQQQAYHYHHRAVAQYTSSLGPSHPFTAGASFRLAEHLLRLGHLDQADKLLRQAKTVFEAREITKAPLYRTIALLCKLRGAQTNQLLRQASRLKVELLDGQEFVPAKSLDERIEEMVYFWWR